MREWNLKPGDPLSLTLAADVRLGQTNYCDDQVWELSLGSGDPPALALHTTYGLRARAFRLFTRFTQDDLALTDPAEFANPPVITHLYPNFLALAFSPFSNIDVEAEYWVPESQGLAGRIKVTNHDKRNRQIRLELIGQLTPTEGQRMAPIEIQAAPVLSGQTGGLAPVVFLTGGPSPGSGSYPALTMTIDLSPGASRQLTWAHAALHEAAESFNLARTLAARKLEAERARLELLNAGQVDIYTGNPEWDVAFALSQKIAYSLFLGPTPVVSTGPVISTGALPHASFVITRQPDQGYSMRGDGSDYNHLWNGQTPLEAYYLAGLILPTAPELAKGIIRNYLAVQAEDGFIDWKPGLAGQRSRLLAMPLLVSLAWRIYEATEEIEFLEEVFPGLLRFVRTWFTPQHDRDGDGIPEWDHPLQAGAEDHPLYSRWHPETHGVEINSAETPSLCALLYRECESLIRMARLLGRDEPVPPLLSLTDHLKVALETAWDADDASYHDWDRDTHHSTVELWLGERRGPGEIHIQRSFENPVRLVVHIDTSGETTRHPHVFVYGTSASGHHRIARVSEDRFKWYLGTGILTGEHVYGSLDYIDIQGVDPNDKVTLFTAGYHSQNQTVLLPIWAGIPDKKRARAIVKKSITNQKKYWRPFGIPACARCEGPQDTPVYRSVHLPWNTLIGEGMVRYGFLKEAAELVTRLMAAVVQSLKRDGAFRRYYHAETGQGIGEKNALNGLAPMGLFLEVLGVRLISPRRVFLTGFNPFPWPVTVKYRGMTILRQKDRSMVIFPDGQTAVVNDPAPRIVSLEVEPVV